MNKDIKYIAKRVAIGVLIALIITFIKSCNVKAITNTGIFNTATIPDNQQGGRFYTCNGVNNCSSRGYSLLTYNGLYYALPSQANYVYGTNGGVLSLCNLSFVTDNYYSVTYGFVSSNNDFVYPNYSAMSPKLGVGGTVSSSLTFDYQTITQAQQIAQIPGLLPVGEYIFTFTIVFKAPSTNTCLNIAFSSYSKTLSSSELAFIGYKYENLGNQPLTQTQIQNIINNSNQNIINNATQNTQSIINNQNQNTQAITDAQQDTTDSINDLNDTMKDDSTPNNSDFNDAINSVTNAMPTNSTIASLVTMPITFIQKIIDGLGGTCSPITIGDIYGFTMVMPCINPADYIGIIWNIIDVICAGFFAFVFGKKLVVIFHNITSMHEGGLKEAYD